MTFPSPKILAKTWHYGLNNNKINKIQSANHVWHDVALGTMNESSCQVPNARKTHGTPETPDIMVDTCIMPSAKHFFVAGRKIGRGFFTLSL